MTEAFRALVDVSATEAYVEEVAAKDDKEACDGVDRLYETVDQTVGQQGKNLQQRAMKLLRSLLAKRPLLLPQLARRCKPKAQVWVFLFCLEQVPTLQVTSGRVYMEHIWPSLWKLRFNADPEPYFPVRSRLRGPLRPTAPSASDDDYQRVFQALSDEESFQVEAAQALLEDAVEVVLSKRPTVVPLRSSDTEIDPLVVATQLCHDLAYWHLAKGRVERARAFARKKCGVMEEMSENQLQDPFIEWTEHQHRGICGACGLVTPDMTQLTEDTLIHAVLQRKRLTSEQEAQLADMDHTELLTLTANLCLLHQYLLLHTDGVDARLVAVFCLLCVNSSQWSFLDSVVRTQAARIQQAIVGFPETDELAVLRDRLELHLASLQGDTRVPPPLPRAPPRPLSSRSGAVEAAVLAAEEGHVGAARRQLIQAQEQAEAEEGQEGSAGDGQWVIRLLLALLACIKRDQERGAHGTEAEPGRAAGDGDEDDRGGGGGGGEYSALASASRLLAKQAARDAAAVTAVLSQLVSYPWSHAAAAALIHMCPNGAGEDAMAVLGVSNIAQDQTVRVLSAPPALDALLTTTIGNITQEFLLCVQRSSVLESQRERRVDFLLVAARFLRNAGRLAEGGGAAAAALSLLTHSFSVVDIAATTPRLSQLIAVLIDCLQLRQPFLCATLLQYTTPVNYELANSLLRRAFADLGFIVTQAHASLLWDLTLQEMFLHLQREKRSYTSQLDFPARAEGPHTLGTSSPLYQRLLLRSLTACAHTLPNL